MIETAAPARIMEDAPVTRSGLSRLLQRLHDESEAQVIGRARAQFQGSDDEFNVLAQQYASLAPRLKGAFLQQHGLSSEDSAVSQGTDLSLAISAEMGRFLHNLVLANRPARILELGSSCGVSSLHMADALRTLGEGTLVATELDPAKCTRIREYTVAAGLSDYVDVREGDIFKTMDELDGVFGMVFIDVWSDIYLRAFRQLERLLQPGSVVVTDNMYTAGAAIRGYKNYLDSSPRYSSMTMDFESGVEFTMVL